MIDANARVALERFQKNPVVFFTEVLGVETLEAYQTAALIEIAENDRIVISACHDVGKSWMLARVVIWYVTCFPYCKVITTAPTYNQVKNILWAELRTAYARAKFPLGGKLNLTEWQVTKDGDWFAIGFTPRNELSGEAGQGTPSSFQGFHAPYVLVVFDEATGVPNPIWTMAEGLLTSANVKFVAIGNPTSRASRFFKCFTSPAFRKIKLSCFDSPNLIANGITDLKTLQLEIDVVRSLNDNDAQTRLKSYKVTVPYLLTLKWVVERGIEWGVTHPLFISKVLGLFPEDSPDTLIPYGIVEAARYRLYYPTDTDRKCIGVDVARFGSDNSVVTALHGFKFLGADEYSKYSTGQLVGAIIQKSKDMGDADIIVVDGTGLGGGVVDGLNEAVQNDLLPRTTEIREVQFGAGFDTDDAENRAKYVNVKARMFSLLADDLKLEEGLGLPPDDIYLEELPTILYRYDSKGRKFIESKDDYKKRTGRKSPDRSDSLALANYGRYDEINVGRFPEENQSFPKPFAASLGSRKQW